MLLVSLSYFYFLIFGMYGNMNVYGCVVFSFSCVIGLFVLLLSFRIWWSFDNFFGLDDFELDEFEDWSDICNCWL